MQTSRRDFLKLAGGALAGASLSGAVTQRVMAYQASPQLPTIADPLLHLLNRTTYGVRPDELTHARELGAEAYLDEQLNPTSIPDAEMDALLKTMPILFMSRQDAHKVNYRQGEALIKGMVLRAVHSRRQLFERVVEFWTDHFNVASQDLAADLVVMHREAIRKHALGNFREMLFAVAQSPAMLYYLNQAESSKEHPNENYARELLELHTLGVDGGYTESDVKAAARALTGWTVHDGTETGFYFNKDMHDTGKKDILGHHMPAERGIEDGLHLLTLVANHPSTAQFVCRKLCIRFVSDNPPQPLIDSAAQVWAETNGEIKPVLKHILMSEEFTASAGQKLRRPLDFFIGALRATGTSFQEFWLMLSELEDLTQVPYDWHPPNGYPDAAGAWANPGGLLARWNVAMDLTHRAYSEDYPVTTELYERMGNPQTVGELVDNVAAQVFGVPLVGDARSPFINYVAEDGDEAAPVDEFVIANKLGTLYGLMLASPLYQWR
ncbi:MAG: DUF1800 family protein [Chloroflexi bacterium]|nr:DUF1800 family protein [Chloroflexota bacterium]MCC6895728.1 DUF1800 family protein [Anaerolineae bacterium]